MKTELPYSLRAASAILRDIGECSCLDCAKFYLMEFRSCLRSGDRGVLGLARENCYTGAVNFNLDMRDEALDLAETVHTVL